CAYLFRQRVVFGQRGAKLGHRRVRVDAGLLDALGPVLDQWLGGFLPLIRLLRRQLEDFMAWLGPDLVDTGILELAPGLADAAGGFGVAVVVDRLLLAVGHLVVLVLVHNESERRH